MEMSYEQEIRGRTVIDGTGRVVGQADGLVVDTASWSVRVVRVKLDRDVAKQTGQPHKAFRAAMIDVPVSGIAAVGDTIVLRAAIETFAPESARESARE